MNNQGMDASNHYVSQAHLQQACLNVQEKQLNLKQARDGGYFVCESFPLSDAMRIVLFAGRLDECLEYMRRAFDPSRGDPLSVALKP